MANAKQLKLLKTDLDAWNKWCHKNQNQRPDLSKADLGGANLRDASLYSANLWGANLAAADLRDAHLCEASLAGANLQAANLLGANLEEADLRNADFRGANLQAANLRNAHLGGASLWGANLAEADLVGANLLGANLRAANLLGANLGWTVLADVDLTEVCGPEEVRHRGPSTVGTDALTKSKGKIPEVFLRGCGLQDWEIAMAKLQDPDLSEAAASTIGDEVAKLRFTKVSCLCFISYSDLDKPFARRLHDGLQERGIRCWLDENDEILPGGGLRLWDKVLLCCSAASLNSQWAEHEIDQAFERERLTEELRGRQVPALIALDLDGHLFSGRPLFRGRESAGTVRKLQSRLAADFTGWQDDDAKFDEPFERVVRALRTEGARSQPLHGPPPSKFQDPSRPPDADGPRRDAGRPGRAPRRRRRGRT